MSTPLEEFLGEVLEEAVIHRLSELEEYGIRRSIVVILNDFQHGRATKEQSIDKIYEIIMDAGKKYFAKT
jgi:predicted Ser/Thr protein kinase